MRTDEDAAANELARRLGRDSVAFTATGSAAIEVALEICGVGRGDEVIVPDVGCHSIAAAVVRRSAIPVFVAVGRSLSLDAASVATALSRRTRAVVAAHHYGLPCDVASITAAVPPTVSVIEDVAQTWGTHVGASPCGSMGMLAVMSFGASKPVSLGGGGAVLGSEHVLAGAVSYGDVRDRALVRPPSSARMPVALLASLERAVRAADSALVARRAAVRRFLGDELSQRFTLPPMPPDSSASWTRVPLYSPDPPSATDLRRLEHVLGAVQQMHALPPSELPMFLGFEKRVVLEHRRVSEPLLVKIG